MILYDLKCKNLHKFEAWFPSSEQYEVQRKKGLIKCPNCNSSSVEKALMAPNVKLSNSKKNDSKTVMQASKDKET